MASVRLAGITQYAEPLRAGGVPRALVKDISFTVPDGQFWVLVGPSGCGKSTILRTIAGLLPVSTGELFIGDRLVNQVSARQRDVAMVFQNYALYPHMSVAQNLAFGLKMRGVPRAKRQEQAATVAAALGLEALMDRKPGQLSGGQQQRVALGRALARQPQVFLLDEPLSNLDAQLRETTRTEIKQLHRQFGITTLYVTHDQTEAMTLADQLIVLDQGQIQQIGSPQTVYAAPANRQVAQFLGAPPMNLMQARFDGAVWVAGTRLKCPGPVLAAVRSLGADTVWLGVRPEQVQLVALTGAAAEALPLRVTVAEPQGRDVLVRGQLADGQELSLFVASTAPAAGSTLTVRWQEWFVFDAAGDRCYPPME